MYHKTILSRFAAGALAGASLFASTAAFAGEVTIWCWDPNFNVAIMKEAAARYTAKHPDTTFNVVDFAKTDVEQKLQTALSSGTTDALPDIVLIEDYGAQKYLQSFPGAFAAMSDKVVYCIAVDRNGYVATHNRKYCQPQRGDVTWDTANSRYRRIFNDRTGLASARNTRPFLLQTYRRDMGGGQFIVMKEAAAPITVNGRHWGGLRLAFKF